MTETNSEKNLIDKYFPETSKDSSLLNINLNNGLVERWSAEKDIGYIAGSFDFCGEDYRDLVLRREGELVAEQYKVNLYYNDATNKTAILSVRREE